LKKRILWITAMLLVLLLTLGLTACDDDEGGSGGDGNGPINDPSYNDGVGSQPITVTYFTEAGGAALTATVTDGRFTLSPIPTKEGYVFLGLFDSPTGGSCIVDAYGGSQVTFTKSVTLYAQWSAKSYTVLLDPAGGSMSGSDTMTVTYGSYMPMLPVVEKPGFEFVGWTDNVHGLCSNKENVLSEFSTFNSLNYFINNDSVTLYATFKEKKLTVTFDYNDGSYQTDSFSVKYGDTVGADRYPQMDTGSRVITGWSLNRNDMVAHSGPITSDLTLYAIWKDYKTFTLHAGNGDQPTQIKVFRNEFHNLEAPQWNGYEFDGWYTSTLFSGVPVTTVGYGSANSELYAKWIPIDYTLHLQVGDGTSLPDMSYNVKDTLELPTATRQYCTFIGWCLREDLSDTPFTTLPAGYTGELTLYAKFAGEDRTVIPDACGGSLAQKQVTVEYGNFYQLPVPSKEGYLFVGWFAGNDEDALRLTDENGKSLSAFNYAEESTTVYAKYSKKYYVRVEINLPAGGSVEVKEHYANGGTVAPKLTLNTGYIFEGYYVDNEKISDDPNYTFLMEGMDVTLEVRFKAKEYTFTLNSDGGFCQQGSASVVHGESYLLPVAWKQGYLFSGWSYNGQLITDETGASLESWSREVAGSTQLKAVFIVDPQGESFIVVKDKETFLTMLQFPDRVYSLVADIDLSGVTWNPVAFKGQLYGNNFTIKNLTVTSNAQNVGLFTVLTGTVRDLNFENVTVKSEGYNGNAYVGVVCGTLQGGKIENVKVLSGSVSAGVSHVGGIAGYVLTNSTVNGCVNHATVTGAASESSGATGGIVGHIPANAAVTLTNCENHGAITGTWRTGGIVGALYENIKIYNVLNTGAIVGSNNETGGIVGSFQTSHAGTFDLNWKAVNRGAVTGNNSTGGLIGYAKYNFGGYATLYFNDSLNEGTVVGNQYVGGIVGYGYYNSTNNDLVITVSGQKNLGNVTGKNHVGGIYGYVYSDNYLSVLKGSSSSAKISGDYYIGGIIGKADNLYVDSCSNKGSEIIVTGSYVNNNTFQTWVGGYVGYGAFVSNCRNECAISVAGEGKFVGGIAGYVNRGVSNCENLGAINAPKCDAVGGVVGGSYGSAVLTQQNLTNKADVTGKTWVGGVYGYLDENTSGNPNHVVTDLRNEGNVTGVECVGGILGSFYGQSSNGNVLMSLSNWHSVGNVTGDIRVGGVVGKAYGDYQLSRLTNATAKGVITGRYYVGGIVGMCENIVLDTCSNEGTSFVITGSYLDGTVYRSFVGGIAGYSFSILNSTNHADITVDYDGRNVAGIVGHGYGVLQNCTNLGNINAPKCDYVGGITGNVTTGIAEGHHHLENKGSVAARSYVGGIFGRFENANSGNNTQAVEHLNSEGNVSGELYVGGIVGHIYYNSSNGSNRMSATDWSCEGDVTGNNHIGGLIGFGETDHAESILTESTYSGKVSANYILGGIAGKLLSVVLDSCSVEEGSVLNVTGNWLDGSTYRIYAGGIAGQGYSIFHCKNSIAITITTEGDHVGGIAGYTYGVIENCENTAEIHAPKCQYVGGIVGRAYSNVNSSVNSYSKLTNSGKITGLNYVGGVAGYFESHCYYGSTQNITDLTNSGEITGALYVGGVVGSLYDNSSNSTLVMLASGWKNEANVTGTGYVGGLIGTASTDVNTSKLSESSSSGAIKAAYRVGGLVGSMTLLTLDTCSNEGTTVTATGFENSDSFGNNAYVGGYAGYGYGFINCHNASSITLSHAGNCVGGIVGYAYGSLENCSNEGEINAPKGTFVGGVVGRSYSGDNSFLPSYKELSNSGKITGKDYVGGVLGSAEAECYYGGTQIYRALSNTGLILGESQVGGVVGNIYLNSNNSVVKMDATDWSNVSNVTGNNRVGGLIGDVYTDSVDSKLSQSTSIGNISADYYLGGLVGSAEYLTLEACYNAGTRVNVTGYLLENSVYYTYAGGFAGKGYRFIDCVNTVEISVDQKGSYVGGIAGYVSASSAGASSGCKNTAKVTAKNCDYVGGLYGYFATNTSSSISNFTNEGDVLGKTFVGGLFGYHYTYGGGAITVTLTDLTNSGSVEAKADTAGGIVGFYSGDSSNNNCTLNGTNWKNTGDVKVEGHRAGGLLGYGWTDHNASKIQNSSSAGEISAEYYVGGLAGYLSNIELNSCSNKGTTIKVTGYLLDNSVYYTYAGGFAGYGYRFTSCENNATVSVSQKGANVGGIAGWANGYANSCANLADITAPNCENVGGIYGQYNYGGSMTMTDLSNEGDVTGKTKVGGIYGYYYTYGSGAITINLNTLENEGAITASGESAGGIAGYFNGDSSNNNCTFTGTDWENSGDVTGDIRVGGLIGHLWDDYTGSKLQECSSSGTITGRAYVGGLAGCAWYTTFFACDNIGTKIVVTGNLLENSVYYLYVGGYAGRGYAFTDCVNYADLSAASKGYYVGGIAGYCDGSLSGCENYGGITAANATYVGGLVGRVECYANISVTESLNEGDIIGKDHVGGLFGEVYMYLASYREVTFSNLQNKGDVTASGDYAGGIAGYHNTISTNNNCLFRGTGLKNSGNVTSTGGYVGGLFGYLVTDYAESKLEESSSSGAVKGAHTVGGLVGWATAVKLLNCSNEGASVEATGSLLKNDVHYAQVGGYVGYSDGNTTITGCDNAVDIIYSGNGIYVGGIAGYCTNSITDFTNVGEINAPRAAHVGGIVGRLACDSTVTVTATVNEGKITGKDHVGGLFGEVYMYLASYREVTFSNLQNKGDVIASGDYVGGIAGYHNTISTNNNCLFRGTGLKNSGDVTSTGGYVGGLFGYLATDYAESKLEESSSSGAVKGLHTVGGIAGWVTAVKLLNCSNEGATVEATGSFLQNDIYYAQVGGYVGYSDGLAPITGCNNAVNITYSGNGIYVGGIAGYSSYTITDCTNSGTITASKSDYVGGIVGRMGCSTGAPDLKNCTNSGKITGNAQVGGLVGEFYFNYSSERHSYFSDLTNSGAVLASGENAGGIVGNYYFNSTNSVATLHANSLKNTASITGTRGVGGIFGKLYTDTTNSKMEACSSSGAVKGVSAVGGLVGYAENLQIVNCSNDGATVTATGAYTENGANDAQVGGYVGYFNGTVSGCVNKAIVSYSGDGKYVGGIAGHCVSTITDCENQGNITASNASYVGGIVGRLGGSSNCPDMKNCSNSGTVQGKERVGGLMGDYYVSAGNNHCTTYFASLTNTGNVVASGDYVGGIIGYCYGAANGGYTDTFVATDLKNTGNVRGGDFVGGLIGEFSSDTSASSITGYSSTGTIVATGTKSELVAQSQNLTLK